jgi:hypothetical protein
MKTLSLFVSLFFLSLLSSGCASAPKQYIYKHNRVLFKNPEENALLTLRMIKKNGEEVSTGSRHVKLKVIGSDLPESDILSVPAGKHDIVVRSLYYKPSAILTESYSLKDVELQAGRIYYLIPCGKQVRFHANALSIWDLLSDDALSRHLDYQNYPRLYGEDTGRGKIVGENSSHDPWTYEGELFQGFRKGHGKYISADNIVYEGEFTGDYTQRDNGAIAPDFFDGRITASYPNGAKYEGEWQGGRYHGTGIFTSASGDVFQGQWVDNRLIKDLSGRRKKVIAFEKGELLWSYEGGQKAGRRIGKGACRYANGDCAEGRWLSDNMEGSFIYRFADGLEYEGEMRNNKWHGRGVFRWSDGRNYEGSWFEGHMQGNGVMSWPCGDRYEGGWEKNLMNGTGRLLVKDGRVYDGNWEKGALYDISDGIGEVIRYNSEGFVWSHKGHFNGRTINGEGVSTWANGSRYEGGAKDGYFHGNGKMLLPDGQVFEGSWNLGVHYVGSDESPSELITFSAGEIDWHYKGESKDGIANGIGEKIYANGDHYEGGWKQNRYDGQGKLSLADGSVYDGKWISGMYVEPIKEDDSLFDESLLVMFEKNKIKSVYEGEVNESCQKHGIGILEWDGNKAEGEWEHDRLNGLAEVKYADGSRYEGAFKDGLYHGEGNRDYSGGSRYEGEWKNGKRHGQGKYTHSNFEYYEGEWLDDMYNGQGAILFPDGSQYEGEFVNNRYHGKGKYSYSDGNKFIGGYIDGRRDGFGTVYTHDDQIEYSGYWRQGEYQGADAPPGVNLIDPQL